MRFYLSALFVTSTSLFATACGSGETGSETSPIEDPTDDGRYHPASNGVHTTEEAACSALANAYEKRLQSVGCSATTRPCPDFLRTQFGTACMEYDQGSVDGCVAYYNEQKTCEKLSAAIGHCAVAPYPGTEPAGCP